MAQHNTPPGTALASPKASSPFLSLRFLLLHTGRQDSALYTLNGLLLLVSYAVCRLGASAALLAHGCAGWAALGWRRRLLWTLPHARVGVFAALMALSAAHFSLNLFWFGKIAAHARRRLWPEHAGPGANASASAGADGAQAQAASRTSAKKRA